MVTSAELSDRFSETQFADSQNFAAWSHLPNWARSHQASLDISTREDLEVLLKAGLASGESRPVRESDWERLRQRAVVGIEARESG